MEDIMKFCPICNERPVVEPNGVCEVCYSAYKNERVHTLEWIERDLKKRLPENDSATLGENLIRNIELGLKDEKEAWERLTKNGLSALMIAVDAIDSDDDLPTKTGHKRRIAFMRDFITCLPDSCFLPATRLQLNDLMETACDYWDGKVTEEKRKYTCTEFRILLGNPDPTKWEVKSLPLWMIETEEDFDWMWYQWFECVWDAIPQEFETVYFELLQSHFQKEIAIWAKEYNV
jgi:hypothetical protein